MTEKYLVAPLPSLGSFNFLEGGQPESMMSQQHGPSAQAHQLRGESTVGTEDQPSHAELREFVVHPGVSAESTQQSLATPTERQQQQSSTTSAQDVTFSIWLRDAAYDQGTNSSVVSNWPMAKVPLKPGPLTCTAALGLGSQVW